MLQRCILISKGGGYEDRLEVSKPYGRGLDPGRGLAVVQNAIDGGKDFFLSIGQEWFGPLLRRTVPVNDRLINFVGEGTLACFLGRDNVLFYRNSRASEKGQYFGGVAGGGSFKERMAKAKKCGKFFVSKYVFFLPRINPLFSLSEHIVKKPKTPLLLINQKPSYFNLILWILIFLHLVYYFYTDSGYKSMSTMISDFVELYYMEDPEKKEGIKFSDVKGHEEVKAELSIVLEYLKDPESFEKYDIQVPRGILLTGPPGVGKTMLVRALAGEAKVRLFVTSGAEFEQMLVGVGAARVRSLFNKARKAAPCLIFIDEIDTFGQKRSYRDHRATALNQFLVEMDGFKKRDGIIVIAATNNEELLEPSLLRPGRFDRKVFMDIPDLKTRKELIESSLQSHKNIDFDEVDVMSLARKTIGLTGAEIENVVNMACIKVVKGVMDEFIGDWHSDGAPLNPENEEKLALARPKLDNSIIIESILSYRPGRKEDYRMNEEANKHIAICKAAQAVVAIKTPNFSQTIDHISILPRKGQYGYIIFSGQDSDVQMQNRSEYKSFIDISIASKVAESMAFESDKISEISSMAIADSTNKARRFVAGHGMPDSFSTFIPQSSKEGTVSDQTLSQLESESLNVLKESESRVKEILTREWHLVEKLADRLLLDEEINGSTLKKYIDNFELNKC